MLNIESRTPQIARLALAGVAALSFAHQVSAEAPSVVSNDSVVDAVTAPTRPPMPFKASVPGIAQDSGLVVCPNPIVAYSNNGNGGIYNEGDEFVDIAGQNFKVIGHPKDAAHPNGNLSLIEVKLVASSTEDCNK